MKSSGFCIAGTYPGSQYFCCVVTGHREFVRSKPIATKRALRRNAPVDRYHAILLEAWRGKVPFSTFKRVVVEGFKEYGPDRLLIEKKASGISLIQELRKAGLPIKPIL